MTPTKKDLKENADIINPNNLLLVTILLLFIGLLVIYTSSSIPAFQKYGDSFHFLKKQAMTTGIGLIFIYAIVKIPFRFIELLTLPSMVIALILISLTLVPSFSHSANGASRWITIFGITYQPAEFAKLALILFLSKNLSRPRTNVNKISHIVPNVIACLLLGVGLMIQPDFGSTFLLFTITFFYLYIAGIPKKYTIASIVAAIPVISFLIWHKSYRLNRLLTFLNPWDEIRNGGFQIIQSYLGFQNGGLFGLGLGESRQKLYFLPEAHTDFILSVIGEELGLAGVLLIIFSFAYIAYTGIKISLTLQDSYKRFLCFGITMLISIQSIMNMGVTMGLLPTKGISLPFISNGSSSLLSFMIAMGVMIKLGYEANIKNSN